MLRPTHTGVNRTSLRHDAINSSAGTRTIKTVFLRDHTRRTRRTPDDGSARIWERTLLNTVGPAGPHVAHAIVPFKHVIEVRDVGVLGDPAGEFLICRTRRDHVLELIGRNAREREPL